MEAINLDLLPGAMPPIVHVSQGDVGRQFKIAIYDDTGAAYSLTGKTLSIVGHKGDGHVFQYAIPSSAISGNVVTITTEEQMTPAAGKALCEIRIEQNGTKLGTANFVMDVEQGPADMGSLSISALYMIDALFKRAQEDIDVATEAAATATQKASEASASATAAAGSASNAATEAGNAADSATAAAKSATAAYNSANNAENVRSDCVIARNDCWGAEERAKHYAEAATNSATAAAKSATAASGYADAADTSADNAANYATAASGSATAAATSANTAAASETAAGTSENNAAASATAAANSASNAAKSESNASTSEANAAKSATNAANSATAAANSATAAANSATAAATSESKIADMTVSSQSVPYTQSADVVKTEAGGVYNLDFKIPRGEPTSGHDVEANPSGAATGDLTKLGIDGNIYAVSGLPDYSQASDGDVLTKTASGPAWAAPSGGGSTELPKFEYVNAYGVDDDDHKYTPTPHISWLKGDGTHIGDIFVAMVEYVPKNSDQLECPLYYISYSEGKKINRISNWKYESLLHNWLDIPDTSVWYSIKNIINELCIINPDNVRISSTSYDYTTNKIVFSALGTPVVGYYIDNDTYAHRFAYYVGGIIQSTNVDITNFLGLDHLGVKANPSIFDVVQS